MSPVTGCESCQPETFDRSGPRESEGHLAVRFGDGATQTALNGELIVDVLEMVAGPGGWAIRLAVKPPPVAACSCGSGRPELMLDRSDGYSVRISGRPSDARLGSHAHSE